jgi:hypothetical protein
MAIYRLFASNVADFEGAKVAKNCNGPYKNNFSTRTIEIECRHPVDALKALEEDDPKHPVFTCGDRIIPYLVDEHGNNISTWPDPEYPDEME